jgi:hypothetical protein
MVAPLKYDWDAIRLEFIEGLRDEQGEVHYPNLRELSVLHGCSYDRIRRVASEQQWTDEKIAFQAAVQRQRREAKLRELSTVGVEFDAEALGDARVGLRLIGAHLARIAALSIPPAERSPEQLAKYRIEVHPGEYVPLPQQLLDASEMNRLARAALAWQRTGKVALGDTERYGEAGLGIDERPDVAKELMTASEDALYGILMSAARSGLLDDFDPEGEEVIEVESTEHRGTDEGPYPVDDAGGAEGDPQ